MELFRAGSPVWVYLVGELVPRTIERQGMARVRRPTSMGVGGLVSSRALSPCCSRVHRVAQSQARRRNVSAGTRPTIALTILRWTGVPGWDRGDLL